MSNKPQSVDEYTQTLPTAARPHFDTLREIAQTMLPEANEVISYAIPAYKTKKGRAICYISGWKDHVSVYPVPKDEKLQTELEPYIKGKGTLWFDLKKPLPTKLIEKVVLAHASQEE